MIGLTFTETSRGWIVRCGCDGYESAPKSLGRAYADVQAHVALPAHRRHVLAGIVGRPPGAVERVGRFGRACSTTEVAHAHAAIADATSEVAAGPFLDALRRELGYLPSAVMDAVVPALTTAREVYASHRAIAERCGR